MGRTLLIGNARTTWREWLKAHRQGRDLLCLDPADPQQGVPARVALFRGEHPAYARFYGSLDPQRSPHVLMAALAAGRDFLADDGIVQSFVYRPTPLLRQTLLAMAELLQPERVIVARGTLLSWQGLPGEIEEIELDEALPPTVQHAQRKAQWLRVIEEGEEHEVDLREVAIEGARLGSGNALSPEERNRSGLSDVFHLERCGSVLLAVVGGEPEDWQVARALDVTGCARAVLVEPHGYDHLVCAFARKGGEEIGMGMIRGVDWADRRMRIRCSAVPPAQLSTLRIGSLRVDPDGRELGEVRPWQV